MSSLLDDNPGRMKSHGEDYMRSDQAKVLYFNWHKARKEDGVYNPNGSLGRVTWTGELLTDRPDLYDWVDEVDIIPNKDYISTCDKAFREFNCVEEGDMAGMHIRSMSVGDVVLFPDGNLYVCQGCGWKEFPGNSLVFWNRPKVESQNG